MKNKCDFIRIIFIDLLNLYNKTFRSEIKIIYFFIYILLLNELYNIVVLVANIGKNNQLLSNYLFTIFLLND